MADICMAKYLLCHITLPVKRFYTPFSLQYSTTCAVLYVLPCTRVLLLEVFARNHEGAGLMVSLLSARMVEDIGI